MPSLEISSPYHQRDIAALDDNNEGPSTQKGSGQARDEVVLEERQLERRVIAGVNFGQKAGEETPDREAVERDVVAPNGQILPDWMTYSEYNTEIDGLEVRTWSIVILPQTYYGPSIPLGPDWVYGGSVSPTASVNADSTGLTSPRTTATSSEQTTEASSLISSALVSTLTMIRSTSSTSRTTQSSRTTTRSSISSTSAPTSSSVTSTTLSSSTLPASSSSATPASSSKPRLVPLLPALLASLLFLLFLLLLALLLFCFWRRTRRRRQGVPVQRDLGPTNGSAGWVTPVKPTTQEQEYIAIPPPPVELRPEMGERSTSNLPPPPLEERSAGFINTRDPWGGHAVTNEKSALLTGYVPQHHRQWSSGPPPPLTPEAPEEMDDELVDLVHQNMSLLQRLTLGLGFISRSNSSKSSVARSGRSILGRKASGNSVERRGSGKYTFLGVANGGNGGKAHTAGDGSPLPVVEPHQRTGPLSTIAESEDQGSEKRDSKSTGAQGDTSGTAGALPDDPTALFFRPPHSSHSSRDTGTGTGNSRGTSNSKSTGNSRVTGGTDGGGSTSGSGSARDYHSSWYTSRYGRDLPPGAEPPHWISLSTRSRSGTGAGAGGGTDDYRKSGGSFPEHASIGVPSTHLSEDTGTSGSGPASGRREGGGHDGGLGDMGEFGGRKRGKPSDRFVFPAPPTRSPTTSSHAQQSEGDVANTSPIDSELLSSQGHHPPGQAIDRKGNEYRHAPLSPFGSKLSTPIESAESGQSSQSHVTRSNTTHTTHSHPQSSSHAHSSPLDVPLPSPAQPPGQLESVPPQRDEPGQKGREGRVETDDTTRPASMLRPLENFFSSTTPPGSAGSGSASGGKHRSFIGEPLVDMQELASLHLVGSDRGESPK